MKLLLLTTLFSFLLIAQENPNTDPKVYESLGNEIYTNVPHIEKLKTLKQYAGYKDKIDTYIVDVQKSKTFGYEVESGARANIKLDYLEKLREYKKVNDYFVRSAHSTLKFAIDTKDNSLFIGIVNSGLIDRKAYKKQIIGYYKAHKEDIDPKGIIQTLLDEEVIYKKKKKKEKSWKEKTKKQLQEEKIARLRKNDELDNQALEKKLSEEVKVKKENIRQTQERELFR